MHLVADVGGVGMWGKCLYYQSASQVLGEIKIENLNEAVGGYENQPCFYLLTD